MSFTPDNGRYARFLDLLPRNGYNVTKTAIEAGFAPNTAKSQQKRIMAKALQIQIERAQEIIGKPDTTLSDYKKTMTEIVGLSPESVFERLRFIATQEKDLASALKVLSPLAKEHKVVLNEDNAPKITVPVLNVTVKERSTEPSSTTHVAQQLLCDTDETGEVEEASDGGSGAPQAE